MSSQFKFLMVALGATPLSGRADFLPGGAAPRPVRLLLFMSLSLSLTACASESPTRSECIVKIVSSSPATTRFRDGGLRSLVPSAFERQISLEGYRVTNEEVVYLQFGARCRERFEMSRVLLSDVFSAGTVSVSEEQVTPGIETISMTGSSWRD